jgi:outer membrane protein assembly factor BamB
VRSDRDLLVIDVRIVDRRAAVAADAVEQPAPRRRSRVPAVAIAVLATAVLAAAWLLPASRSERATTDGPQVVARVAPGGGLTQVVSAFGSAWVLDNGDDLLLRMDPATRRVTARIPLRAGIAVAAGDGAIWVGEGVNDLLRIDPRSNRVVARVALERGSFSGGAPVVIGNGVWVVGSQRAVLADARSGRVTASVALGRPGSGEASPAAALGGDLVVATGDRRLLRLDGRTGARKASVALPRDGTLTAHGGSLYLVDGGAVSRIDPASGQALWRAPIDRIGPVAAAGGRLWAEAPGRHGDGLVALDPRSGRTVARLPVGEVGVLAMERIGPELWMATAGGDIVVVRP